MNRSRFKLSVCTAAVLLMAALSAFGQGWPVPAKTPRTDVACGNTPACYGKEGQKVIGYPEVFKTFTGRFLDSVATRDYQYWFRTARARKLTIAPDRNRVYMILGSALAAYDVRTFFTRLESNEPLWPSTEVGVSPRNTRSGEPEAFLKWDEWYYAEAGGGWDTLGGGDGQERLFGYDWDDRGNVYLAYGAYSWGIVKDSGGNSGVRMPVVYQHKLATAAPTDEVNPRNAYVLKSDGAYYVVIAGFSDYTNIFNVTNAAAPTKHRDLKFGQVTDLVKTADGSRIAVTKADGTISIYKTTDFLNGLAPMFKSEYGSGTYGSAATDGTNFFAGVSVGGIMNIAVFKNDGQGNFTETRYPTAASVAADVGVRYGAGYITAWSLENTYHSFNIRLFKLNGMVPVEVPLDGYFAKHYTGAAPSGYTYPMYSILYEPVVYKNGSKYHLLIADFGLGDVYELKAGDSATPKVKKAGTTPNPNSSTAGSGPYYGDEITFTSTPNGTAIPVTWEWGDGTPTDTTPATAPDVLHQFHGLSAAQVPVTRTVTAINANDTNVRETLSVTLKKPTVRVGIKGTDLIFLAPNASAPARIVSGDEWIDASDGAVEGHVSEWNLDGVSTRKEPSQTLPVGDCGTEHRLIFTGHYGKHDTGLNYLVADAPFSINGISYVVRPFGVDVSAPTSSGTNVVFKSAARASARTADLPAGGATACTYTWELVDANGTLVPGAPRVASQTATIATIPDFVVPRSTFQGATNWKARLTVSVAPALITGATCQAYATAQAVTSSLSGPDPGEITKTGCDNAGGPCSLTIASLTGNTSGWSYQWSATGPSAVSAGAAAVYAPTFSTAGSYTVTVKVSNALGDATKNLTINVTAPTCSSAPTDFNSGVNFVGGGPSYCNGVGSTCSQNESITFSISPFGWTQGDCDKYTWSFGDGTSSTAKSPTKAYTSPGTYTVTVKIEGGLSTGTVSTTVKVGTGSTGGNCATIIPDSNVYITFNGAQSGCTSVMGKCTATEAISFNAASYGYDFSCGSHSFSWSFGDGTTASVQSPTKSYATDGTYNVVLSITSPNGTVQMGKTVTVGSGTTGNQCGTMIADSNVYIAYNGSQSGCTTASGNCAQNEAISFNAASFGYNFGCGSHSFSWNFGDGSTASVQSPQKSYANAGTYTVTLSITNPNGTVQMSKAVTVGSGGGGQCPAIVPDSNVYIGFTGPTSGCTASAGNCQKSEQIAFTTSTWNYQFSCGTHSFLWTFGDGTTSTQQNPTKAYANDGIYNVTLAITNGNGTTTLTKTVTVGTGATCGTMKGTGAGQNIYVNYSGPSSQCNPLVSTACTDEESINFTAGSITGALGYSFSCATHTYSWEFGDGKTGTGMNAAHKYDFAGTYTVKLTIKSPTQTETTTRQVVVSGKAPVLPTNRRRSTTRR